MNADEARARRYAEYYRVRGFQPLPSSPTEKRPLCKYAEWWDEPAPVDLFDRFPTTNIQVMTGRRWRLLVIDLDGPAAVDQWNVWNRTRRVPRTWITHSGGGGMHVWFRLPIDYPTALPKAVLWKGDGPHQAIERLCDRSLVVAPPSIHPRTGAPYLFDCGGAPRNTAMPADCPDWVLRMRPLASNPVRVAAARTAHAAPLPPWTRDPIALAKSWGVRFTGRVSAKGWAECHAIDRDDVKPSAAVHVDSGVYTDRGSGASLSLPRLGVALRQFDDVRDAAAKLNIDHKFRV